MNMLSRERVYKAIEHKPADRLPLAFDATYEVIERLVKYLGIDKEIPPNPSSTSTYSTKVGPREFGTDHEIALRKKLGVDLVILGCPTSKDKTIGNWYGFPLIKRLKDNTIEGAWGIKFKEFEYPYGTYIEMYDPPLSKIDDYKTIVSYPSPDLDLYDYASLSDLVPRFDGFFIFLMMNGFHDISRFIRGTEKLFIDLVISPNSAETLLDKVCDFNITYLKRCMEKVKGKVDGVFCGDDFGSQKGMMMSPKMWRKFIKPRYEKTVSVVHSFGLKYCHHSCGGIRPIIPDLIEIGVDILNPIQPRATGMDPFELGNEFGKEIVFFGGIDEQETLPHGTVEDVKEEVRQRIRTLGKYNGYIISPSHDFQPDTPIENVLAIYEEVLNEKL
ncbi:MAG: uroporphyrinogen decarboxylase family protein [Pelolinea sp.]|nr:uroporphyrinogen decarboxylase family protein [Pelolinea sp.]